MKLFMLLLFALSGLVGLPRAHAWDVMLKVQGIISVGGCTLTADSKSLAVEMGSVADGQLSGPSGAGPERRFQLYLENCSADTGGARVSFSGAADGRDPTLLAIQSGASAASGVGIALLNGDGQPVALNQPGRFIPFDGTDTPDRVLDFYARYTANGDPVRAGEANASATFTVEYQ